MYPASLTPAPPVRTSRRPSASSSGLPRQAREALARDTDLQQDPERKLLSQRAAAWIAQALLATAGVEFGPQPSYGPLVADTVAVQLDGERRELDPDQVEAGLARMPAADRLAAAAELKIKPCWAAPARAVATAGELGRLVACSTAVVGWRPGWGRDLRVQVGFIDIDAGGRYWRPDGLAPEVEQLLALVLEHGGAVQQVRSSHGGGLHLIATFPEALHPDQLARVLDHLARQAGMTPAPGHCETFPNVRAYVPGNPVAFNGVRLPGQLGSAWRESTSSPWVECSCDPAAATALFERLIMQLRAARAQPTPAAWHQTLEAIEAGRAAARERHTAKQHRAPAKARASAPLKVQQAADRHQRRNIRRLQQAHGLDAKLPAVTGAGQSNQRALVAAAKLCRQLTTEQGQPPTVEDLAGAIRKHIEAQPGWSIHASRDSQRDMARTWPRRLALWALKRQPRNAAPKAAADPAGARRNTSLQWSAAKRVRRAAQAAVAAHGAEAIDLSQLQALALVPVDEQGRSMARGTLRRHWTDFAAVVTEAVQRLTSPPRDARPGQGSGVVSTPASNCVCSPAGALGCSDLGANPLETGEISLDTGP